MSSRVHVIPVGHRGEVSFILPVKAVFGRVLCDTDGTIGCPTEFDSETALKILSECDTLTGLYPGDRRDLDRVRRWALAGWTMLADWQH